MKQALLFVLVAANGWGVDCASELGHIHQFILSSRLATTQAKQFEARLAVHLRQLELPEHEEAATPVSNIGTEIVGWDGSWSDSLSDVDRLVLSQRLRQILARHPDHEPAVDLIAFDKRSHSELFLSLFQYTPNQIEALVSAFNTDQIPNTLASRTADNLSKRLVSSVTSAALGSLGFLAAQLILHEWWAMPGIVPTFALSAVTGFAWSGKAGEQIARESLSQLIPQPIGQSLYERMTPSVQKTYDRMRKLRPGLRYIGLHGFPCSMEIFQWGTWVLAYVSRD